MEKTATKTKTTKKVATKITAPVYDGNAKKIGEITLPDSVFGVARKDSLIHQVVVSMLSNARKSVAHAKDRSEVRGGGKKPWRQKGTGRARHGSNRSPIWVGGGVTHGPLKEKNYDKKINRKMKIKALFSALSAKLSNNKILFVEGFDIKDAKTKEAANFISKLSSIDGFNDIETKPKNSALFVAPKKAESLSRSFRNIPNVSFDLISNMNPVSLLQYKYVIFLNPKDSIEVLEEKIK